MIYLHTKYISGANSVNSKRRKTLCNTVETDKVAAQRGLDDKTYTVVDKANPKAKFWRSYQCIVTIDGKHINYVLCRFCKRLDKYDTKGLGTSNLNDHASKCTTYVRPITEFVQRKDVNLTIQEKNQLTEAIVKYCYKDLRPFMSIECDGIVGVLEVISSLSSKYGGLDQETIKKVCPCANTVISCYLFISNQMLCSKKHVFFRPNS